MSTHLRVVNLKDTSALRMFIEGADLMISNSTIATYKYTVSIFLPVNLGSNPTPRTNEFLAESITLSAEKIFAVKAPVFCLRFAVCLWFCMAVLALFEGVLWCVST